MARKWVVVKECYMDGAECAEVDKPHHYLHREISLVDVDLLKEYEAARERFFALSNEVLAAAEMTKKPNPRYRGSSG